VGKVQIWGNNLTVYPAAENDASDLVDLTIFGSFRPGVTFSQARELKGDPDESSSDHYGPYVVYHRGEDRIQIGHEEHRSGPDAYRTWTLTAYPYKKSVHQLLDPGIARYVNPKAEKCEIIIMNSGNEPAADVDVKNSMVESITWIRQ
jgi:hypothetical protein